MTTTEALYTQTAWDKVAVNFDRYVTPTANWDLAKKVLSLSGLRSGMLFLDVASGSGALSLPAARQGAKVLAVDISPKMIELLNERAKEERLFNLNGQVMDGHHLALNDNTFDISGSQFGIMLFTDFKRGLLELVRVTKPGGTVFIVAFGPIHKVEFLTIFLNSLQEAVPEFSNFLVDDLPLPFQISEEGILHERLESAGLENSKVVALIHKLSFRSGKEMWDWVTSSNPIIYQMINGLDAQQRKRIIHILDKRLRERNGGKELAALKVAVNVGIGKKARKRK